MIVNPNQALHLFPHTLCTVNEIELQDVFTCNYIYPNQILYAQMEHEYVSTFMSKEWNSKWRVFMGGVYFIEDNISNKKLQYFQKVPISIDRHAICKVITKTSLTDHVKRFCARVMIRVHLIEWLKKSQNFSRLRHRLYNPEDGILFRHRSTQWKTRISC